MATKTCQVFLLLVILSFLHNILLAQAPNDTCATAQVISVNAACQTVSCELYNANTTTPNITGSCANGRRDVWYQFTQPSNSTYTTISVTLTSPGTTLTTSNVTIEMFNSHSCTNDGATMGCQNISAARTYTN